MLDHNHVRSKTRAIIWENTNHYCYLMVYSYLNVPLSANMERIKDNIWPQFHAKDVYGKVVFTNISLSNLEVAFENI
jgi:hypothetical protein